MTTLLAASLALLAWTWVGYPLVILAWAALRPRRVERRYATPTVTAVVAARDEEINIRARIENLLAQDYPADRIEVVVVSDGSRDRTVEAARSVDDPRVRVIELAEPAGKAVALNRGVEAATGEVIVFADARQRFDSNVFAELTAWLWDESVGGVSGELVIEPAAGSDAVEGVGAYWSLEKAVRHAESRVGSVVGATGSIYAIRRHLYTPLEPGAILDDVLVPMRIVLAGRRVLFARSARAFDVVAADTRREFRRKVRTLAGNFQMLRLEPRLLDPRRNPVWFQLVSHKLCRLVAPWALLAAWVSALAAVPGGGGWVRATAAALAASGMLALAARTPLACSPLARVARAAWTVYTLHAAAAVALVVWSLGRTDALWRSPAAGQTKANAGSAGVAPGHPGDEPVDGGFSDPDRRPPDTPG